MVSKGAGTVTSKYAERTKGEVWEASKQEFCKLMIVTGTSRHPCLLNSYTH